MYIKNEKEIFTMKKAYHMTREQARKTDTETLANMAQSLHAINTMLCYTYELPYKGKALFTAFLNRDSVFKAFRAEQRNMALTVRELREKYGDGVIDLPTKVGDLTVGKLLGIDNKR